MMNFYPNMKKKKLNPEQNCYFQTDITGSQSTGPHVSQFWMAGVRCPADTVCPNTM